MYLNTVKMKKNTSLSDYIKASRKGSREAEIEHYGHSVSHHKVHLSKKAYNRKKVKADVKGLPFDFMYDLSFAS